MTSLPFRNSVRVASALFHFRLRGGRGVQLLCFLIFPLGCMGSPFSKSRAKSRARTQSIKPVKNEVTEEPAVAKGKEKEEQFVDVVLQPSPSVAESLNVEPISDNAHTKKDKKKKKGQAGASGSGRRNSYISKEKSKSVDLAVIVDSDLLQAGGSGREVQPSNRITASPKDPNTIEALIQDSGADDNDYEDGEDDQQEEESGNDFVGDGRYFYLLFFRPIFLYFAFSLANAHFLVSTLPTTKTTPTLQTIRFNAFQMRKKFFTSRSAPRKRSRRCSIYLVPSPPRCCVTSSGTKTSFCIAIWRIPSNAARKWASCPPLRTPPGPLHTRTRTHISSKCRSSSRQQQQQRAACA